MRILITTASRHGSTDEIAAAIADELQSVGHDVDVRPAADARLDGYEAAIVGSAVYMGSWLPEARGFIASNEAELQRMPVWLFSSGPLGWTEPKPLGDPSHMAELINGTKAREHHIFAGKLERDRLGFGERAIVKVVKAPYGDFRDWDAVRDWARVIASSLRTPAAMVT